MTDENEKSNIQWKYDSEKKQLVIRGSGKMIFSNGCPWNDLPFETVFISEEITSIAAEAFKSCKSLKSFFISNNIESIGNYAFSSCSSLEKIEVSPENKIFSSKSGVLFNKDMTELIQYPIGKIENKYEIPITVKKICDKAFMDSDLSELHIGKNVSYIGINAFANCSKLKLLYFNAIECTAHTEFWTDHDYLKQEYSCYDGYFEDFNEYGPLDDIKIINSNEILSKSGDPTGLTVIFGPIKEIPKFFGKKCSNLVEIKIMSKNTIVGEGAFNRCPIKKIICPPSFKKLENPEHKNIVYEMLDNSEFMDI